MVLTAMLATGCARKATIKVAVGTSMMALGTVGAMQDERGYKFVGYDLLLVGFFLLIDGAGSLLFCDASCDEPPLTNIDAAGVLVLVNSPKETPQTLAAGTGIALRLAARIIGYRDGRDAAPRTPDDNRYDSLDELRAIEGVTREVIDRFVGRARELGYAR